MANSTANDAAAVYERQMLWELSRHRKQQEVALNVDAAANEGCTFEPQLVSKQTSRKKSTVANRQAPADARRGPASQSARTAGQSSEISFADHVARYQRGRKERKEFEAQTETARLIPGSEVPPPRSGRIVSKTKPSASTPKSPAQRNGGPNGVTKFATEDEASVEVQSTAGSSKQTSGADRGSNGAAASRRTIEKLPPPPTSPRSLASPAMKASTYYDSEDDAGTDQDPEETFFEQLQRERRDWQRERLRMQQVIELQQNEIGKRGDAVETRAMDIATSFTAAVGSFEQRLIALETSMQTAIREMRAEVKTLGHKVSGGQTSGARLAKLEATVASLEARS